MNNDGHSALFGTASERQRRVHAALLLGLTDLFVGASSVALLLLVLTNPAAESVRIPQTSNLVRCRIGDESLELKKPGINGWQKAKIIDSPTKLASALDSRHLSERVTIIGNDLPCLWRIQSAVNSYNYNLGKRNQTPGPIIVLDWIADDTVESNNAQY